MSEIKEVTVFPKINLGLHILGKRPDGFHDLETIYVVVKDTMYQDILQLEMIEGKPQITVGGLEIPSDENLCYKAWLQIQERLPSGSKSIRLAIKKKIPAGAGLGGGSADAGNLIRALAEMFELNVTVEDLMQIGAKLGSDVPFFISDYGVAFGKGRGTNLEPIELDLSGYEIKIYPTDIFSSTKMAYASLDLTSIPKRDSLKELLKQPVESWKEHIFNDFEPALFRKFPALAELKDEIYAEGAVYASMTGSGSAFYGIFRK